MDRLFDRCTGALIGALALALVALAAGIVDAGPLDPTGAPSSTGRPIDELNGAWNRTLATNRFFMFGSQGALFLTAVHDRETNLVWERSPAATQMTWQDAIIHCAERVVMGNRKGWRLPTAAELGTLIDTSNFNPALPVGHPFILPAATGGTYWTSETHQTVSANARQVAMASGVTLGNQKIDNAYVWCVRGSDPAAD